MIETTVELGPLPSANPAALIPLSVIIAARNEARNLPQCLKSLGEVGEVYIIDSQSSDDTVEIARSHGAKVVQFHYHGGWPKKRQWAIDTLPLAYDWVLLLDADEVLTPELVAEMREAIIKKEYDGYFLSLQMYFLGRLLRHSGGDLRKLSLFRHSKGRYECRLKDQDSSMCDMEVHEHIVVHGRTATLKNSIEHRNVESLAHYIQKHNEYSNWEARVWQEHETSCKDLPPAFFGAQAQRRRWLKKHFLGLPGSPALFFLYKYFFQLGFLDGVPGLIYCALQGVQFFHIKAKIYERNVSRTKNECVA